MRPDFRGGPVIFLKEVKSELAKVTWPTRDQVIKLTIVVVVVSFIIGLYIGGLDLIMTKITALFL
ncbi:preprotein translocase subunit SecE [Candidatus Gottesmanbacteria bacterium RIFCSPHIGHO2_02_FULL_39_14]|uniref:Protein translocase subunit SecE n=1 Tax=Candidatus Gottesmanbacteria bacterium RIFCSPHIGHO2_02_FULL_39_14 TaxID=1798383 RepID=A0A1F6A2X1_9BACT|nr:MAG: preprotein translocase subunit SecE [Candidatus Gottesmanbacteria bacterium RIFCSPHIGHO2_02_FULL_39_14]